MALGYRKSCQRRSEAGSLLSGEMDLSSVSMAGVMGTPVSNMQ